MHIKLIFSLLFSIATVPVKAVSFTYPNLAHKDEINDTVTLALRPCKCCHGLLKQILAHLSLPWCRRKPLSSCHKTGNGLRSIGVKICRYNKYKKINKQIFSKTLNDEPAPETSNDQPCNMLRAY